MRVLSNHGLVFPVETSHGTVGPHDKYPYYKPSDFIKALDGLGMLDVLFAGHKDLESFRATLAEFWQRFEQIRPQHGLLRFAKQNCLDLSLCLPVLQHGDEGRSKKKLPVCILQWQPCLGKGISKQDFNKVTADALEESGFPLNYLGHSFVTRFLCTAVLGDVTKENPGALDDAVRLLCADLKVLQDSGVALRSGHCLRVFCLGNKGDWSWLASSAHLTRSYRNLFKKVDAKTPPKPICHWCKAGAVGYPYEDVTLGVALSHGLVHQVRPRSQEFLAANIICQKDQHVAQKMVLPPKNYVEDPVKNATL